MKFSDLDLHPQLKKNLEKIQFVECTPIQASAIPEILQGRDVAGLAQTGTGKTAAFLIPLIDRILKGQESTPSQKTEAQEPSDVTQLQTEPEPTGHHTRYFKDWRRRQFILVLVPTRELAEQVYENAQKWLDGTSLKAVSIYGGTTYEKQKAALKDGVEIVIATPGRLIDLYKEHHLDLQQVRAVVFDEADRMFDMGFKDDMKFILRRVPRERQFLVFSATLNFEVHNVAYEFGAFPVEVNVSKDQPKADNVKDTLYHVGQDDKPRYLLSLLKKANPKQAIIFSNFKHNVERIARFLTQNGVPAVGISSLLTQAQRNRVMEQFKGENDRNILVATDVAARGLDILGVDLVINFELPDDPENYVHRIGRTGRAGHQGVAYSMCSDRDVDALGRIEDYLGHKLPTDWVDDSELVNDFKEFPRDFGPRREPANGRGPGRGPRGDSRPPRGEGPRRSQDGGKERGRRFDRDRDKDRDRDRQRGPRSDRPAQEAKGKPTQKPQGQGGRPQGQRPHRDQPRKGSSQQGSGSSGGQSRHGQAPRRGASAGSHRSRPMEKGTTPSQRRAPAGIGEKVSGFFKKLLGKSKATSSKS